MLPLCRLLLGCQGFFLGYPLFVYFFYDGMTFRFCTQGDHHAIFFIHLVDVLAEQDQQFFENLAKQSATLPCQACKKDTLVPIRLDDVNTFDCDHCDVTNAVYVDISTAVTTTPLTKIETIRINEAETT